MIKPFQFTDTIRYQDALFGNFQGVDFASDVSKVSNNRSPDAYNIIGTQNGIIEKRTGYQTEFTSAQIDASFDATHHALYDAYTVGNPYTYRTYPILNMYRDDDTWLIQKNGRIYYFLNNAWVKVKRLTNDITVNKIVKSNFKRLSRGKILLFSGGSEYILTVDLQTKVVTATYVQDTAYVPTTTIGGKYTGGGEFFEPVNLITWKRKNSLRIDSTDYLNATTIKLDSKNIDSSPVSMVYTYLNTAVNYVDILNFNWNENQWIELVPSGWFYYFNVDRSEGLIRFYSYSPSGVASPHAFPLSMLGNYIPVEDNIVVSFGKGESTFNYASSGVLNDNTGMHTFPKSILSFSSVYASFGLNNNDNFLFLSDGSNKDNWGNVDTLYFSDLDYAFLGNSGSIMGYSIVDNKLITHMNDIRDETSLYVRSIDVGADGTVILPKTYGVRGIPAIAKGGFSSLEGQSLFLSKDGIYAMLTSNLTNTQNLSNRSYFVEYKMLQNPSLKDAIMINNEGFLYVWIGTECYIADSRKKANQRDDFSESFQYEWYYWTGLPVIRSLHVYNGDLWVTTDSGSIMRFKNRTEINAYEDDGVPVKVRWTSPVLFLNNITARKTLKNLWTKVGMYNTPSSIKIYYRTGGNETLAVNENYQEFNFANIDFTNLTFNTDATPRIIVTNRTVRKFMNIQFSFENDENQSFGLIEFALKYRSNTQYKGE